MRPHMKLAQYSHQCGPRNVWTWKRVATKWPEGNTQVRRLFPVKSWYTYKPRLGPKSHDMVTFHKALVESNWQAVKTSFLFVLDIVVNHTNFLQFTFENNFYIGVLQLFPSQWATSFACYAGVFWALWHAGGGGGAMYSMSESWEDTFCPLWPQLGPQMLKVILSDWSQLNHHKVPISVQNYLILIML